MRGIRTSASQRQRRVRFIPADAGNTEPRSVLFIAHAVHPRGCGEYAATGAQRMVASGSSPRMRGILGEAHWLQVRQRFIPADAGNTRLPTTVRAPFTVHPRGCGEYLQRIASRHAACGSSPRMRGILVWIRMESCILRFIPADAGNTKARYRSPLVPTVHPRGCGEYLAKLKEAISKTGSSPRMRGIRSAP